MVEDVPKQLPLAMHLQQKQTFTNFFAGENRQVLVYLQAYLQNLSSAAHAPSVFLWGSTGAGKTHLLQACCHFAAAKKNSYYYLPLTHFQQLQPHVLQNLEEFDLVVIDAIDAVSGDARWEEALFHFYNRISEVQGKLIVTATKPLHAIQFKLADLQSRLSWGGVFQIHALDDSAKLNAIQAHAHARGIGLSDEVAKFILGHCTRNMAGLIEILANLDQSSLAQQRKITVPFVKEVLGV